MLGKIRALQDRLRKSEQRVAQTVLAQPERVLQSSIAVVARLAQVSEPTVMRFCQALGCKGFQDFKLQLAQDLAASVRYIHRDIASDDSSAQLADKIIDGALASLTQIRQQLHETALDQAIALLTQARRIEFYGLGGATVVATDAQLKFFRLGVPAVAYADAYIHTIAASLLGQGDAVVAISNSGRSKDLLQSVDLARAAGAAVIAITASGSPLAQRATVALTVDVVEDQDHYAPIKARIAHMVVIDILAIGVALRRGPDALARLARAQNLLQEKFV